MQDPLYIMTYAKMAPYWIEEIQSYFSPGVDNRFLAIAACAFSDDITLPKVLLRYMVAAIINQSNPAQVGITRIKNQDDRLTVNLTVSSDEYITLGQILDNYKNIDLKLLNQGWLWSDRCNIELTISRRDLITVIKNKILSDQTLLTQLHNALLLDVQSFLTPATVVPVPKGVGSSKT